MRNKRLLFALLTFMLSLNVNAQECDTLPVMSSYMIGGGRMSIYDTYLSPRTYSGGGLSFMYERMSFLRKNNKWSIQHLYSDCIGYLENSPKTKEELSLFMNYSYGMHYRMKYGTNITLGIGGVADVDFGIIVNTGNSNNALLPKFSLHLMPSVMGIYHFNAGRQPFIIRYQFNPAIAGCVYTQEYHNISLDEEHSDGEKLAFTSLHNNLRFNNLLTVDIPFRNSSLRVAYKNSFTKTKLYDLDTQMNSHIIMIGFTTEFISVGGRKSYRNKNIKHTLY